MVRLLSKGKTSAPNLSQELDLPYPTVVRIVENWAEEGLVRKESVQKNELGGIKNTYALSEGGKRFFKDLLGTVSGGSESIIDEKQSTDEEPHSPDLYLLNDLVLEIPEFLTDMGVRLNRAQHEQFLRKIGAFLERKGLRTGR